MMKNVIVVELKIDRKYDYYRIDKWIENTIIKNKMKKTIQYYIAQQKYGNAEFHSTYKYSIKSLHQQFLYI